MYNTRRICWGALFIALGILLPITFHMVGMGKVFLPMHIPILLAGFFCGPAIGAMVGFITLCSAPYDGGTAFHASRRRLWSQAGCLRIATGLLLTASGRCLSSLLLAAGREGSSRPVGYLICLFWLEFSILSLLRPSLRLPGIILQLALFRGYHQERSAAVLLKGKEALAER